MSIYTATNQTTATKQFDHIRILKHLAEPELTFYYGRVNEKNPLSLGDFHNLVKNHRVYELLLDTGEHHLVAIKSEPSAKKVVFNLSISAKETATLILVEFFAYISSQEGTLIQPKRSN